MPNILTQFKTHFTGGKYVGSSVSTSPFTMHAHYQTFFIYTSKKYVFFWYAVTVETIA